MIQNITTADGAVATIVNALKTLGFKDHPSVSGGLYWEADTNEKIYLYVYASGSNTIIVIRNSSNSNIGTNISFSSSLSWKITYEKIGDSIAFGFNTTNITSNHIQFLWVAPTSQNDDWLVIYPYNGNFVNARTQVTATNANATYGGSTNGVQLIKAYDGARFCDNLYVTPMSPSIPSYNDTYQNNYVTVEVGNDEYLCVNISNSTYSYVKWCIKRVVSA